MPPAISDTAAAERRRRVLDATRDCFLTFGFAKTTLDDIARRAGISRTLLYRSYRDKNAIFGAVFDDWLMARRPAAVAAARGDGPAAARLHAVCRILLLEPWSEMICTPLGPDFLGACERIAPDLGAAYDAVLIEQATGILGDAAAAEVFALALAGCAADRPAAEMLDRRAVLLIDRFTRPNPAA